MRARTTANMASVVVRAQLRHIRASHIKWFGVPMHRCIRRSIYYCTARTWKRSLYGTSATAHSDITRDKFTRVPLWTHGTTRPVAVGKVDAR